MTIFSLKALRMSHTQAGVELGSPVSAEVVMTITPIRQGTYIPSTKSSSDYLLIL
jgi:hypothetical protein